MASNYPGSLDSFDTIASDKKTSDAVGGRTHRDMHNDLGDAIESVQTELGTNPSGSDATVAARLSAIEAGTNLATGAVTSAKIADGTIVSGDVAASTFAAFGTVGNLLTANQAGCVSGFTSDAAITYGSGNFAVASGFTYVIATVVPVTPGRTYTARAALSSLVGGSGATVYLFWRTSGGVDISSLAGNTVPTGQSGVSEATGVAPPTAAYALWVLYPSGTVAVTVSELGLWAGSGGQWAMPGTPIVHTGIRPNPSNTAEVQIWNDATATWITV